MPLFGPPNIEKLKAKGDVKGLIKALDYRQDLSVQPAAAQALGQVGDPRAVEALVVVLQDPFPYSGAGRLAAAGALVAISARCGDPTLAARVTGLLVDALQTTDSALRAFAAAELDRVGWQPDGDELRAAYWVAKGQWPKCVELGAPAVEMLVATLEEIDSGRSAAIALGQMVERHPDAALHERIVGLAGYALLHADPPPLHPVANAAAALGMIGKHLSDIALCEHVVQLLRESFHRDARSVAGALAMIGENLTDAALYDQVAQALRQAFSWESARASAATALGQIRDAGAAEPLARAACDDNSSKAVREAAASALVAIGGPAAGALITELPHEAVGQKYPAGMTAPPTASDLLLKIGSAAIPPLIAALDNRDVDWIASRLLVKFGEPAVEPLIAALGSESLGARRAADSALQSMGAMAMEARLAALSHKAASVREAVARSFGQAAPAAHSPGSTAEVDVRAVESLIATLQDDAAAVREAAASSLGEIGDRQAVEGLIATLRDGVAAVREAAARSLGQSLDARAAEPLIAALQDEAPSVREAAANSLGSIGDVHAVEPLMDALKDEDPSIRSTAANALGCLARGHDLSPDQLRALPQDKRNLWEWAKERAGQCQSCGRIVPLGAAKTERMPYGDWSSCYVYYCDVCQHALFDPFGNHISRYDISPLEKG